MTHAAQLIKVLRTGWKTWGDLEATRISACPWKRINESGQRYLKPGEKILRKVGADGLTRLRVVRL
jgi:hypothetical protein